MRFGPNARRVLCTMGAVGLSAVFLLAPAAAAAPKATPAGSHQTATTMTAAERSGAAAVTWGVAASGQKWYSNSNSKVISTVPKDVKKVSAAEAKKLTAAVGATKSISTLNAVKPNLLTPNTPTGVCSLYLGYINGGAAGFRWKTDQICSGYYGAIETKTQIWRSSWSGPRGYSPWILYPSVSAGLYYGPELTVNWSVGCSLGGGYYDYNGVAQGYASQLGWSVVVQSTNKLSQLNCGTSHA